MSCPLCGGETCMVYPSTNASKFVCQKWNRSVSVVNDITSMPNEIQRRKLYNLIFEWVMRRPYFDDQKTLWWFYYEPTYHTQEKDDKWRINLAEIQYPNSIVERIDRILLNLYNICSDYGTAYKTLALQRAYFAESDQDERHLGFADLMSELGYLTQEHGGRKITAKGWQRIEELMRSHSDKKQAFIAMAFCDDTKLIRESFRKAIIASGFSPLTIDEKEHNNQIVPEILHEIDKSNFLVMDATIPNFGAYYEAGYALGKGKQVIICCSEESFKSDKSRPHFDIAQKSMVVWQDYEELEEKLKKRIDATVPLR